MTTTTLVWFRQDLRIEDHQALTDAAARGAVLPVYIHAPDEEGAWAPGAASRWWLHHSLAALQDGLARRGLRLVIRRGGSLEHLQALLAESGAHRVVWQRRYEPVITTRDAAIKQALRTAGYEVQSFGGALLREPWEVMNQSGRPYQVFTPYWRAAMASLPADSPLPAPPALREPPRWPKGLPIDALGLLPRIAWDSGLRERWTPGESPARRRLDAFVANKLREYVNLRDVPAQAGTSLLSPSLHFGELSPRQVLHAVRAFAPGWREHKFLAELGWREFAHHLLFHFPQTPQEPLRHEFREFAWRRGADAKRLLLAWQRGETGIPIVDAGMRELWTTGYMHNRVRMIVASFLVKNLRIHWLDGARWFWDTLVDADLASNTLGWQWSAGCGADAAPYFRIFNPHAQAERFDPGGEYLRRWVPDAGSAAYPKPIVDLAASRGEALEAWRALRARITPA